MSLLEDITSKDPTRIWSSACAIRTLRDKDELSLLIEHIDDIKNSVEGVTLGGALRPNSTHLDFAIRKLEFLKSSDACPCHLYAMDDMYDPMKEEKAGNIRLLSTDRPAGTWVSHYECTCTSCGQEYRVEEQEYHYTWWSWKLVVGE